MELDRETIQNLLKTEGEVRGVVFKTDAEFVLRKKGEEGLSKVKEELEKLGQPIRYQEIDNLAFYPVGLRVLSLLVIKEVFNFDEPEIKEMGAAAPKVSLIIKLFIQYFFSLRKTLAQAPKMWRKHYTRGNLVVEKFNEKERILILGLKDFNLHPILCPYLTGYFSKIAEMIVKSKVSAQETKCFFRGDQYHQFLFQW